MNDFHTRAVRGGTQPDAAAHAILTPIYQSTTFVRRELGPEPDFSYSRVSNPTVDALERRLGVIEGTPPAVCFGSGMAAVTSLFLTLLKAGDRVVVSDVVYGGSYRLLKEVLDRFGVESTFVDTARPEALEAALATPARLLLLESPANPTLKLADLAACAEIAHRSDTLVAVDNTFMTPVLQQPLELGADVIIYSTTKYQDGHNAVVGGAVLCRDAELLEQLRFVRKTCGTIQSPMNAWLTLQGVKTLPLRMARHCENAQAVAELLETHPRVRQVAYPWLPSFPQHEVARRQQRAGGGMVSFELEGGIEAAGQVLGAFRLMSVAENMGSVETLVTHPATMTHASIPPEQRRATGITDGLVRISVGIEDRQALLDDLSQALAAGGAR